MTKAEAVVEQFLAKQRGLDLAHISGAELLAALSAAGWVVVPKVATGEMCRAFWGLKADARDGTTVWTAMLAARPR